jgi:tungstate transport system ATP-binding protein|tara:strand:+ start:275 stop:1006 length:732 start_codon:yes stop_codon:yes gene_type:complete
MFDKQKKSKSLTPIVVSNLSILLGEIKILDKINCKIHNESIIAILGPNGAGKSMFLKSINGLIGVESRKIYFNSREINDHIRKDMALVFQKPTLLRRTVLENMQFVLEKKNKISNLQITNLLQRVGLDIYKYKPARLLSGGEQQRLSLARALLINPSLLLLDEPTANLDPYSLNLIEEIILDENKKGKTIILTTHDMGQAKRLAKEILFFNKGKLLEQTKAINFFKKPKTKEAQSYINGKILL